MSETATENPPAGGNSGTTEATPAGGDGFKPIMSQDELNRIIGERVARTRAQFGDYDDLKAKAGQVEEWQTKAATLEGQLAELPTRVAGELRTHLIALHGIEPDDADLFLTGKDPETLLKQAQRLVARTVPSDQIVTGEGQTLTPPAVDPMRKFIREVMGEQTT